MNLDKVIEILRNPNADGHILAPALGWSTGEYSFRAGLLQDIYKDKPREWIEIRNKEEVKSDSRATMIWDATEKGINAKQLKMDLDKLSTIIGTLHKLINIRIREEKNEYKDR